MNGINRPLQFGGTFTSELFLYTYECANHTNPFPPRMYARADDGDDEDDGENDE